MSVTREELQPGAVLAARYKGKTHHLAVEVSETGGLHFVLPRQGSFSSLSAAGRAVMDGHRCNGWLFWTLERNLPPARTVGQRSSTPARPKPVDVNIRQVPNLSAGSGATNRWWCSPCLAAFGAEGDEPPASCPAGHSRTKEARAAR